MKYQAFANVRRIRRLYQSRWLPRAKTRLGRLRKKTMILRFSMSTRGLGNARERALAIAVIRDFQISTRGRGHFGADSRFPARQM
jgi:hypothetical protein